MKRMLTVLLLVFCSNILLAQEPKESPVLSLNRGEEYRGYRVLLLPMDQLAVREHLGVSAQQIEAFQMIIRDLKVDLPSFEMLDGDAKQIGLFFSELERRSKRHDKRFTDFWEEVLLPNEADALLGYYLTRFGIEGFQHPAVMSRLEIKDEQAKQLPEKIEEVKKFRRQLWSSLTKDSQYRTVAKDLDLRGGKSLVAARRILSERQLKELTKLLDAAPRTVPQKLTFGF